MSPVPPPIMAHGPVPADRRLNNEGQRHWAFTNDPWGKKLGGGKAWPSRHLFNAVSAGQRRCH
jgi:hypothetical protein